MPHVPAHCDTCGLTFFSAVNVAEGAKDAGLYGNRQQCPSCGSWAKIVEGRFSVGMGSNPVIRQTGGPPVDPELFTRLGLVLLHSKHQNLPPEEVIEKVAKHSPRMAERLRKVADDPQAFATVLAALIAAFAAITACLLTFGDAPPQVVNDIKIYNSFSEGEMRRFRNNLYELRQRNIEVPSWSRDYLEPEEN